MLREGSHVLSHFFHTNREVFNVGCFHGGFPERVVGCSGLSVLAFFGEAIHRGRKHKAAFSPVGYPEVMNWRKFVYADPDKKWSKLTYPEDGTYTASNAEAFFALIKPYLTSSIA